MRAYMTDAGKRIKELRIAKGLTQSELCGNFITRNMLSQIESGKASPSISTLEYISDILDVPVGYLIGKQGSLTDYLKINCMQQIKKLFAAGQWQKCVSLCRSLPDIEGDDEINLILADCHLQIGISNYKTGRLEGARKALHIAESLASKTVYHSAYITETAKIYSDIIESISADRLPDITASADMNYTKIHELTTYMQLLKITENYSYETATRTYDSIKLENPLYRTHISARLSVSAGNYQRGFSLLSELVSRFDSESADAVFRFCIYRDLESVCKQLGDYKNAYEYSRKKGELFDSFGVKN